MCSHRQFCQYGSHNFITINREIDEIANEGWSQCDQFYLMRLHDVLSSACWYA